jgi:hypothetical protein
MQLFDVSGFRKRVACWGMCWEQGWMAPGFSSKDLESPWPWPRDKDDGFTRRWELANLIVDALEAATLKEGGGFYLFPPNGQWGRSDASQFYRIRDAILTSLGIPANFEGAAFFSDNELDRLAAAVFSRCFMVDDCVGDVGDDAWVYPCHGRLYLHFDDEEITWGKATDKEPLRRFDEELGLRGWTWLRDRERNEWQGKLFFPAERGADGDPPSWNP